MKKIFFFVCLLCLFSLIVFGTTSNIIYEKVDVVVPVYETLFFSDCVTFYLNNGTDTKNTKKNLTECYNYTKKLKTNFYISEQITDKRIGVVFNNAVIIKPNVNVINNKLISWVVPIGDRNFKEFGSCTITEKNRGVCSET